MQLVELIIRGKKRFELEKQLVRAIAIVQAGGKCLSEGCILGVES